MIFVALQGTSKIELIQGTTFAVLDNNACTDNIAQFQLPPPTNVVTGATAYTVWARVEGTPGGSGQITTCGIDPITGETICSLNTLITFSHKGDQKFTNVTSELTTLCFVNSLGLTTCVNIFDTTFQNFFWSYNNQGQKVLQLRFYPVSLRTV